MNVTLVTVIAFALFFNFTNGFHDAANAIATTVSTRALSPRLAVGMAAVLNFAGALISIKVATTVATGIVDPAAITLSILLAGVAGATVWNLVTWYLGLPTSSSHALIGGVAGSAIAAQGFGVVKVQGVVDKVLIPSLVSPVAGFIGAALVLVVVFWLFHRLPTGAVNRGFRRAQLVTAAFVAFTHGTNDAQKTMGVMALAVYVAHPGSQFQVPDWIIASSGLVMAAGTYSGGWRIIRTLGQRVVKLGPPEGFASELSTAAILYVTGTAGFPVSTTHTISGSIMGSGSARRLSAVRWGVAGNILIAWVFTIPCAGLVAAVLEWLGAETNDAVVVVCLLATAALTLGTRIASQRTARQPTARA
jgi:PiT family inorganic phosphate transporter